MKKSASLLTHETFFFTAWKFLFVVYLSYYSIHLIPFFQDFFLSSTEDSFKFFLYSAWLLSFVLGCILLLCTSAAWQSGFLLFFNFELLAYLQPLTHSPELAFFSVFFLTCLFSKKTFSSNKKNIFNSAFVSRANLAGSFVYFFAGLAKLITSAWITGALVKNLIFPSVFSDSLLIAYPKLFECLAVVSSWLVLILHLIAPIVSFRPALAKNYHLILFFMYMFLSVYLSLTQVLLGMALYHTFFFIAFSFNQPLNKRSRDQLSN